MYPGPPVPYRGHGHGHRCHHGYRRRRRPVEQPRLRPYPAPWESPRRQAEGSWLKGKDQPSPSQTSLENLRDSSATPARSALQLETDEAFGLAHQALSDVVDMTHAPTCLDPNKRRVYEAKYLPLMVFHELDELLFRSVLKGNVFLTLAPSLPTGMDARTSRLGLHGRLRISIELSPRIFRQRRSYVLGTLLHQMIQ